MKKQTKSIIIVLVIALVLGAVLAVLLLTDPNKTSETDESSETSDTSSSESSEEVNYLLQNDEENIKSVKVSNENGEYTIVPSGDSYVVEGLEKIDTKSATLATMVQAFTELQINRELGEKEDLAEYGLEGNTYAEAELADGTTIKLVMGGKPGESAGRYVLYDGKVYICPLNQGFYEAVEYVVNPASWTIDELTEDETNYSLLKAVHQSGQTYARDIDMTYNDDLADYDLNEPVKATGSITMADELADVLLTFSCASTAKVNPTDAELTEMGFDDPYCAISYTLNGYTHSICVGNTNDEGRYCYVDDDKTVIYNVVDGMISSWTNLDEVDFRDGYITLQELNGVDELTVEVDGRDPITIERTRSIKEDVSEASSGTDYDYVSTLNGKEIDAADMRSFYRSCIGLPILNMEDLGTDGTAVIRITFHHFDSDEDTVVEFYKAKDNDSRYTAYLDGNYSATVRSTSVDEFIESFDSFVAQYK